MNIITVGIDLAKNVFAVHGVAENVAPRTRIKKDGYCFAAGTLVHARNGLVPIEKLRVGDWVLSKPENGEGEEAYKRITNTFCFQEKEVMHVQVYPVAEIERSRETDSPVQWSGLKKSLVVTPNHPFWIVRADGCVLGWERADQLWPDGQTVAIAGGKFAYVSDANTLYRTPTDGLGWTPELEFTEKGTLVDLRGGEAVADVEHQHDVSNPGFGPLDPGTELRVTVYNIEVADYHTYFVGEMGVWVLDNFRQTGVKHWWDRVPEAV